jgi:hypothetical protein
MTWLLQMTVALGFTLAGWAAAAGAQTLTVVSFNVESDRDTDPAKVGQDIARISAANAVDLFGLAEVEGAADLALYAAAASRPDARFEAILARNGEQDRVAILYNTSTLAWRETLELERFPGSRKALVARFRHQMAGREFLFIANHFNRRDAARRNRQAVLIRDWTLAQPLPAVLVGDYNFDFNPKLGRGNEAFALFTAEPALIWLRPPCIAAGTCPATGTQCDERYNSIMDFVFVADRGRGWQGGATVLMPQPDYCARDRRGWSDHRPVLARIAVR